MIELTLIISLVVLFIHATTWEGMINEWVSRVLWHAPPWIKKPLFDCPICMAPWWGSLILLLFGVFTDNWLHPFIWVITLFAAGGINTVLIYIISSDKEEIKVLKGEDDLKIKFLDDDTNTASTD